MRPTYYFIGAAALAVGLLVASPVAAADREQIKRAVDRGVGFLRSLQSQQLGTWPTDRLGATALAGLTLLECDVPANDPAVQKAADYVRRVSISYDEIHTTYCLALSVLFLDRLGEPADVPLIQSLGVRILGGQNPAGGWSYRCPSLGEDEEVRLTTLNQRRAELVARGQLPKPAPAEHRARPELPREIQQLLNRLEQRGPVAPGGVDSLFGGVGDNSNTQFALLALWAARRQGIPVEKALERTAARFRSSQNGDGGWGYRPAGASVPITGVSTPSMTCAGLLGVALGYGSANEAVLRTERSPKNTKPGGGRAPLEPGKDPVIRAGFLALGKVMSQPMTHAELQGLPLEGGVVIRTINTSREYYFLWSMERVAVAYGLNTIGNRDWYAWGAGALVAAQRRDGGWRGKYGEDIDTCFALLFLRRANLSRDLTVHMKGRVKDPGQATLKSGGTGGEQLVKSRPPAEPSPAAARPALKPPPEEPRPIPSGPPVVKPGMESDANQLSKELVGASGHRQDEVLARLRENKGVVYTQALAAAIPQLSGAAKSKAREALAVRLARMTAATLRDKFKDEDPEIRRAAALACTAKADKQFVPDLISLLQDREPAVARTSHAALKELTGQEFAPEAADKWKAWWKKQSGKQQ